MNKRFLKIALLSAVCASMPMSFSSCKDFEDDINNLQGQIDSMKASVDDLAKKIADGAVIQSVEKTADGIVVKTDKGTYTITNGADGKDGQDGATGAAGKDADVWTIGSDGYWYKNNQKTEYRAIGLDGKDGATGATGAQGPQGPAGDKGDKGDKGDTGAAGEKGEKGEKGDKGDKGDTGAAGEKGDKGDKGDTGATGATGNFYRPNLETGCFDLCAADGTVIKQTDIPYTAPDGMTVVYSGNKITFTGVSGSEEPIVINVGEPVGSIEFIPSVMSSQVAYPTTDKPFYYLPTYLSETSKKADGTFKPLDWNKSNEVVLEYRLNPSNAYVAEGAVVSFINRDVTSRADGDMSNLLNTVEKTIANGEMNITTTINYRNLAGSGNSIIAARLQNGQDVVTASDYVAVTASEVDAVIVKKSAKTQPAYFYNRNKVIASAAAETSNFIQQFVKLTDNHNLECVYTGSIDLLPEVELWSTKANDKLSALGFTGASFEFSYPEHYYSNDALKTDQQWFGQLDGTVFSANEGNLTEDGTTSLTPAIDRTPVVRVDAFLTDNAGTKRLVASAYIKIKFVRDTPTPDEDKDTKTINLDEKTFKYSQLTSDNSLVGKMTWQNVNNLIYGSQGLSVDNFWNYYKSTYTVEVATTAKNGSKVVLNPNTQTATVNQLFNPTDLTDKGINCNVLLTNNNTQTSDISFFVNNLCKTEISYKDVDGKGAEFVVTITLTPNNPKAYQPIEIVQKFYVKNDFEPYTFNDNFYNESTKKVQTKGRISDKGWAMQMNIEQVFTTINNKNIFGYFADKAANTMFGNVKPNPEIAFSFKGAHAGVAYDKPEFDEHIVGLTEALTENKTANMQYTIELVNSETISNPFDVEFINPFVAGTPAEIEINANLIGTVTANADKSVVVVEQGTSNSLIYSYVNNALALSAKATGTYKLNATQVAVEYKWNENKGDYKVFTENLPGESKLDLNKATGVITYEASANLQKTRKLYLTATVTFEDLSKVEIEIPVTFKGVE